LRSGLLCFCRGSGGAIFCGILGSVQDGGRERRQGGDRGDDELPFVYGTSKPLSKADFIKECGKLFDQKTRRCFAKAKPVKEDDRDSYSVFAAKRFSRLRK